MTVDGARLHFGHETGTTERNFNWDAGTRKLAPETRVCCWAAGGGSGGILSQKRLKSRGSEMVFATFSMRYFSKKNLTWIRCYTKPFSL